jgi:hypothetical protein
MSATPQWLDRILVVSDQGACRIWWSSGIRAPREAADASAVA